MHYVGVTLALTRQFFKLVFSYNSFVTIVVSANIPYAIVLSVKVEKPKMLLFLLDK